MRRKIGICCMAAGIALILCALILFIYNRYESQAAGRAAHAILTELQRKVNHAEQGAPQTDEMSVVNIDGYDYIGFIAIPALSLELPVMSEWDYSRLKTAPCRQFGNIVSDDLVIAGHNYVRHFGRLNKLQLDDSVIFTDVNGSVTEYLVQSTQILQATDVEQVKNSSYDLVLYTCTYSGTERITVACNRAN